jgi:NAD(P)H dehydrogenase (quinone)
LEFNGSEQMSFLAIAEKISEIVKEPIRYISPKVTDFEAKMKEIGLPDHVIEILSTFSLSIAQGEFDQQSIDLEMVLGRKTKSLYEFLKETYN